MSVEQWIAVGSVLAMPFVALVSHLLTAKGSKESRSIEVRKIDVDEHRIAIEAQRVELEEQKTKIDQQERDFSRLIETVKTYQDIADHQSGQIRSLTGELAQVNTELAALRARVDTLTIERNLLTGELARKEAYIEALREHIMKQLPPPPPAFT